MNDSGPEFVIDERIPLSIPWKELRFSYVRSSGAGGQNVNKVSSKAVLRWHFRISNALPDAVQNRFAEKFGGRLTEEGELVIAADTHRDQIRNKQECLKRLASMVMAVARPPRPRVATKPTKASKRRRLDSKKHHGEKKALRKKI
jgi:ribosome-associated protein